MYAECLTDITFFCQRSEWLHDCLGVVGQLPLVVSQCVSSICGWRHVGIAHWQYFSETFFNDPLSRTVGRVLCRWCRLLIQRSKPYCGENTRGQRYVRRFTEYSKYQLHFPFCFSIRLSLACFPSWAWMVGVWLICSLWHTRTAGCITVVGDIGKQAFPWQAARCLERTYYFSWRYQLKTCLRRSIP